MKILRELKNTFSVPLTIHWSTAILLFFFLLSYGFLGIIYFLLLMGSVLLHEYAHVFVAHRDGAFVKKVIIMALGAAALIEPSFFVGKFKKELKCSAAGPLASFILAMLFLPFALVFVDSSLVGQIFSYLCLINFIMGVFNLLPIYPMDGGRIFNAILSMILSKKRGIVKGGLLAIDISSIVGYVLSGVSIWFCIIYGQYWMAIMFMFIIAFTYLNRLGAIKQYKNFPAASNK